MERQRLASSRHDLLSNSTTRDRMSSPKGAEQQDQAQKQKNSQQTLDNHQADSTWNDI